MSKILLIVVIISALLLCSPVSAKMVTAKVDDKGLIAYGAGGAIVGTLHTQYGEITVSDKDYNAVEINDTIRYDTDIDSFWQFRWPIEVIK